MKNICLFLPVLFLNAIGYTQNTPSDTSYDMEENESGIVVEKFDSINRDENRFNYDNIIFKKGVNYYYSYKHLTVSGEAFRFLYTDSTALWNFTSADSISPDAIVEIKITLKDGQFPFNKIHPDYSQSVISYSYQKKDGPAKFGESTGVIENKRNIWLHPPRAQYFKILEINPFPYIKLPYQKGEQWHWELSIGDTWADARWKTWHGIIENSYEYETWGKEHLDTPLGNLECIIVKSSAKSSLGSTFLTSWFHPDFGFVKLDYTNIDGSKTLLELTRIEEHSDN